MKKLALLAACSIMVVSCGGDRDLNMAESELSHDKMALVGNPVEYEPQEAGVSVPDLADVTAKKIIKDGRMGLNVKNLNKTKTSVDALVVKYNSYYGNEAYNDYYSSIGYDLAIRIPVKNYEKFIAEIEAGDGEVTYKSIDAHDVTEQFYDLETRLANKRSYLERYRELLKRATTIKEILEVESYIRVLEEEIESAEGRLRLMSDQVNYSTLRLSISQDKEVVSSPGDGFWYRMKKALSVGWRGFVSFIVAFFYVWPLWVLLAAAGIIIYRIVRKRSKRAREKQGKSNA